MLPEESGHCGDVGLILGGGAFQKMKFFNFIGLMTVERLEGSWKGIGEMGVKETETLTGNEAEVAPLNGLNQDFFFFKSSWVRIEQENIDNPSHG